MTKIIIWLLPLTLFVLIASACATKRIDLIAEGDVVTLTEKSGSVIFSKIDVHQHSSRTEIEVVVRPRERMLHFNVGTLKLVVTKPDGSEQNIVTDNARIDKHRMGSALQHAHFHVSIPHVLPSGSSVTVSYLATN